MRWKLAVLVGMLAAVASGCAGADGGDGKSCSVTDGAEAGTFDLVCEDGTSVTLRDGKDGRDGVDGQDGENGSDGQNGTDGTDGVSCTIEENGDGTRTLACTDGTTTVIRDGEDGADGTSCTVTDNGDGTKTISCEDGTSVTVSDGADGQDGQDGQDGADGADGNSCTVADNGDGTATISCTDGTSVVVSDGADGADGADGNTCSVAANADGSFTLSCTDGTSVTWSPAGTGGGSNCTVTHSGTGYSTLTCDGTSVTWFVCEPSTYSCDGLDLYSCSADGSAISLSQTCVAPTSCDATGGSCITTTRLADGTTAADGRLEVYDNGEWLPVCDDGWDQVDTDVACGSLGFTTGTESDTTAPTSDFGYDDVACTGTESSIHECPATGWRADNCGATEAVYLTCTP